MATTDQAETATPSPNLKPVFIGMIVASSIPLLLSLYGLIAEPSIPFLLSVAHNGLVVAAAALSFRSPKQYRLAITASLMTFLGWFWIGFLVRSNGIGVLLLGTAVSVAVGIWAFLTLRRPEAKAMFANQADPVTPLLEFITRRIPKLNMEPTHTNVNRVSIATLLGVCLAGFIVSGVLGLFTGPSSYVRQFDEKEKEAVAKLEAALNSGDEQWAAGNQDAAIDQYLIALDMMSNRFGWAIPDNARPALSRAYGRTIDNFVEQGQTAAAGQLIMQAIKDDILLRLRTSQGNSLVASAREEYEAQQEKLAAERRRTAASQRSGDGSSWSMNGSSKTENGISPWSSGGVSGRYRSTTGDGGTGEINVGRDGTVRSAYQSDGFSGRSTLNRDGSGVGEYEVDGQKIRVEVGSDGSVKVD